VLYWACPKIKGELPDFNKGTVIEPGQEQINEPGDPEIKKCIGI
jgi:hypothetical protein